MSAVRSREDGDSQASPRPSYATDFAMALLERNRRKQLECSMRFLQLVEPPYESFWEWRAHEGSSAPSESFSSTTNSLHQLSLADRKQEFYRGQLAFGDELLRQHHQFDGNELDSSNAFLSHPPPHSCGDTAAVYVSGRQDILLGSRERQEREPDLHAVTTTRTMPFAGAASRGIEYYPFEDPDLVHSRKPNVTLAAAPAAAWTGDARSAARRGDVGGERGTASGMAVRPHSSRSSSSSAAVMFIESLKDSHSHIAQSRVAVNSQSTASVGRVPQHPNPYHHRVWDEDEQGGDIRDVSTHAYLAGMGSSVPPSNQPPRRQAYARENMEHGAVPSRLGRSTAARAPENEAFRHTGIAKSEFFDEDAATGVFHGGNSGASRVPFDGAPADYAMPAPCCALSVDRWTVRTKMHHAELQLLVVEQEQLILLQEAIREHKIAREELEARLLLEITFYAALPLQRVCKQACAAVYQAELQLEESMLEVKQLKKALRDNDAQVHKVRLNAGEELRSTTEKLRELISSERRIAQTVLEGTTTAACDAIRCAEERCRALLEESQSVCRAALDSVYVANATRLIAGVLVPSTATPAGLFRRPQSGEPPFAEMLPMLSRLQVAADELAVREALRHTARGTQTSDGSEGRWVTNAEQLRQSSVWFAQQQLYHRLTTMFLLTLENSERERILEHEDDTFAKETASWKATLQHYAYLADLSERDSLVAALQLDLAALRGSFSRNPVEPSGSPAGVARSRLKRPSLTSGLSLLSGGVGDDPNRSTSEGYGTPRDLPLQFHEAVTSRSESVQPLPMLSSATRSRSFLGAVRSRSPPTVSEQSSLAVSRSASVRPLPNSIVGVPPVYQPLQLPPASTTMPLYYHSGDSPRLGDARRTSSSGGATFPATPQLALREIGGSSAPLSASTSGNLRSSASLVPITLPGISYPSVPMVIAMTWTLEDMGREDVMQREANAWRHLAELAQEYNIAVS